jgi:hypothetical protein
METYKQAANSPIKIGTPIPTLTPMMTLLETPFVFPFTILCAVLEGPGMYDVGVPVRVASFCTLEPKGMVLATELEMEAGNVGATPDGTEVVSVNVDVS